MKTKITLYVMLVLLTFFCAPLLGNAQNIFDHESLDLKTNVTNNEAKIDVVSNEKSVPSKYYEMEELSSSSSNQVRALVHTQDAFYFMQPIILTWALILLLASINIWQNFKDTERSSTTKILPPSQINQQKTGDVKNSISVVINKLLMCKNEQFDIDRFDRILGIDQIKNEDYRRVRRARLVKAINNRYAQESQQKLIQRIKMDTDKRMVFYKVLG